MRQRICWLSFENLYDLDAGEDERLQAKQEKETEDQKSNLKEKKKTERQKVDGHADIFDFSRDLLCDFGIPVGLIGELAGQAFLERNLILGGELVRCIHRKSEVHAKWA